jgi:hypothetical protein
MKRHLLVLILSLCLPAHRSVAQSNTTSTDTLAAQIMLGHYNPATYLASTIINAPDSISKGINARVSPDSLHAYLNVLSSFTNRNTGSDTLSATKGIGAAAGGFTQSSSSSAHKTRTG